MRVDLLRALLLRAFLASAYTAPMPESKGGPENRKDTRAPIELKVDYKKLNSFFADYTKNISKGGTFIKTKKPLPIGTRFLFKLTVPSRGAPFELLGEVVWSQNDGEEPGMGIRFIYTTDTQRSEFEGVVEQLMETSLGSELTGKLLNKSMKS
jgi:type IV pilus assembly protein PilZ